MSIHEHPKRMTTVSEPEWRHPIRQEQRPPQFRRMMSFRKRYSFEENAKPLREVRATPRARAAIFFFGSVLAYAALALAAALQIERLAQCARAKNSERASAAVPRQEPARQVERRRARTAVWQKAENGER